MVNRQAILPDLKPTIKIQIYTGGLQGPPNSWKFAKSWKDMFKTSGDMFFAEEDPCGQTVGRNGLVKCNEIIKDHKNTSVDSLKPFSDSYSTIWDANHS